MIFQVLLHVLQVVVKTNECTIETIVLDILTDLPIYILERKTEDLL